MSTTQQTLATYDAETYDLVRRYAQGERVEQLADDDRDVYDVARVLRRAGVLAPYDDPRALAHLYHEYDHTLADLAAVFDHKRGSETIRRRMDAYGIKRQERSLADILEQPDVQTAADALAVRDGETRGRSA